MKLLNQVKTWLSKPGNSKTKLAAAMGYKTPLTIDRWFERKRIPENRVMQVMEVISVPTKKRNQR